MHAPRIEETEQKAFTSVFFKYCGAAPFLASLAFLVLGALVVLLGASSFVRFVRKHPVPTKSELGGEV